MEFHIHMRTTEVSEENEGSDLEGKKRKGEKPKRLISPPLPSSWSSDGIHCWEVTLSTREKYRPRIFGVFCPCSLLFLHGTQPVLALLSPPACGTAMSPPG